MALRSNISTSLQVVEELNLRSNISTSLQVVEELKRNVLPRNIFLKIEYCRP